MHNISCNSEKKAGFSCTRYHIALYIIETLILTFLSTVMSGSVLVRAALETDPKKRVVITGMGVVSCFGNEVDAFYDR